MFAPLAVPIKFLLDKLVGHTEESPKYTRAQLKALLRLHTREALAADDQSSDGEGSDGESISEHIELQDVVSQRRASTERLLSMDSSQATTARSADSSSADATNGRGIQCIECDLASQSLELSRRRLRDLRALELRPLT